MTVNYRDTLNLPNTEFSMKAGLPRKEPEILNLWSSSDLYGKIRKKYEDKELFLINESTINIHNLTAFNISDGIILYEKIDTNFNFYSKHSFCWINESNRY